MFWATPVCHGLPPETAVHLGRPTTGASRVSHASSTGGGATVPLTEWFGGSFVLRMRCYASGWVALALPVWAGLFKGLSGSHETFAYTGRASATQP